MRNTIKLVLFLLSGSSNTLEAQNGYPATLNVTGNSISTGMVRWDWSFGEPFMLSAFNPNKNICINTGFLQNNFEVGVDFEKIELNTPFKIGPNPVIQNLKINSNQNGIVISKIEIVNEYGYVFKIIHGPFSGIQFEQLISFDSVNTGTYFILIHYVVETLFPKIKVFKVIKSL